MTKITPAIKDFIYANSSLTSRALAGIIENKFGVKITHVSVSFYLDKARAENAAKNSAKIQAVREKILDDADRWANKYLKYLDEEVESLRNVIKTGQITYVDENGRETTVEVRNIKDRVSAGQALHKYLLTVIEFVKPDGGDQGAKEAEMDAKIDELLRRRKERRGS